MTASSGDITEAVEVLRHGGLVAFPTETVYGLGADASRSDALARLYQVKGRPSDHPVIVHIASAADLEYYARDVPDTAGVLARAFWPGPLTLVVSKNPTKVDDAATGGRATVGLRVPDHPIALALLDAFGGGIAAPSANRFGRVSPTHAAHVRADLGDDVDLVLEGGASRVGVESTIVDLTAAEPVILRVGGLTRSAIERELGHPVARRDTGEVAAPGTLPSHYAPDARVELVTAAELRERAVTLVTGGARVGVLAQAPTPHVAADVVVLGPPRDIEEFARVLYARLREADAIGLDTVLAVAPSDDGLGAAIRDRLRRASANDWGPSRFAAMTRDGRPIGVFDSGLGGLTVVRSLIDLLPDEDIVYFGDTGRFPYGPKPADEVCKYSFEITDRLLDRRIKMLVVACNSAAAAALDLLQRRVEIPVIGVIEPGIRAARDVTEKGRVGVIGTVGTIASGAYQRAADEFAPAIELTCAACPGFVEFVEAGDVDSDQVHILAERLLAPVRDAGVDTLILGCTHYPLLARTIGDVMGSDVVLVSSADETAFEVRNILQGDIRVPIGKGRHEFITSGDVATFRELGARFLGPEVDRVEAWSWS